MTVLHMSEVDGNYFHCFDTQFSHIAEPKPLLTDVCRAKASNISTTIKCRLIPRLLTVVFNTTIFHHLSSQTKTTFIHLSSEPRTCCNRVPCLCLRTGSSSPESVAIVPTGHRMHSHYTYTESTYVALVLVPSWLV